MTRLRTIPKAYLFIKEQDPNSDISQHLIRTLAKQEKISITKTGTKTLVDVDSLMKYLAGEPFTPQINVA